jgi:hypothetical protein
MRYKSAFAYVKKGYPTLAAWLETSIGKPEDVRFPDRPNVNADLAMSTTDDHASLAQGGILVWIASGRPLGTDGWLTTKEAIKRMFMGMSDEALRAYLKSNNEPVESPPPQRLLPDVPTSRPANIVQHVSTPVRNVVVQPTTNVVVQPARNVVVQRARNAVVQPVTIPTPVLPQTQAVTTGVQGVRRRSAHGPTLGQTGGMATNVVPLAAPTTTSQGFSKCLPDQGPGTMTSAPGDLIKQKRQQLEALCAYAVGDAKRFNGPEAARLKEDALRSNPTRLRPMQAAEQAAGGVIHYPQSKLKSANDKTVEAHGAVCTTFALCAAHILTGGTRQSGGVRVEIIGVARNLGTHMYVVCGRAGQNLADLSTWGSNAVIVDLWAAALNGHKHFDTAVTASSTDWRLKEGALGQFYDNARADPRESELAREVNVSSLDRSRKLAELKRAEDDLNATASFMRVKREELATKIAALKKELNIV